MWEARGRPGRRVLGAERSARWGLLSVRAALAWDGLDLNYNSAVSAVQNGRALGCEEVHRAQRRKPPVDAEGSGLCYTSRNGETQPLGAAPGSADNKSLLCVDDEQGTPEPAPVLQSQDLLHVLD